MPRPPPDIIVLDTLEVLHRILPCESINRLVFMLLLSPRKVRGDAGIQGAITFTGENVTCGFFMAQ